MQRCCSWHGASERQQPSSSEPACTTGESSEGTHELRYPNPEKPAEIDHGEEEGGFNFGGSGGFIWQAMAVHSAVLKGRKEMADISHAETVGGVPHTRSSTRHNVAQHGRRMLGERHLATWNDTKPRKCHDMPLELCHDSPVVRCARPCQMLTYSCAATFCAAGGPLIMLLTEDVLRRR